ncbi:BRCA1-A complex subunit RAP80 isoform X1 [Mauremys reevesii]|uniref:BRCA1-A complex subunit RAP80 isoform X1 n=1 Tax=Mauremys reevesii TaxID=260615 RepID=UPI00193FF0A4|nr:BRCA1-A complex subunit RAP80 isoform X1 [Mauremys reevesii]XP_039340387.1 BRCA1-A complex subunit RAP80 isoform X1 [Mauremys reevesii]XP_039340388.1 BRCA1-A complex subunit RAP80 isoform X1 [Mauremys reevesii]
MPRRKKHAESPDFQDLGGEEEEPRGLVDAKKKRSFVDAFIVISDSDGEQESKEENGLQKKRTKQQLDRVKFAAKRKIAQMTEDEQFALALKMSEQEARQVNCREEEEEELVRKAIAESLNSYQPSDSPAATSAPPPAQATCEPVQSHPAERGEAEIHGAVPPCPDSPHSEGSSHSWSTKADGNGQTDVAKSPLVVLTRLSQEIVESSLLSSIIVSPGKSQPLTKSNEKPSSPARSHSRDTLPSPCGESLISLSPIFGRVTPGAWQLTPRRLFSGSCSTSKAMGGDQDEPPLASTGSSAGEPPAGSSAVLRKGRPWEPGGIPQKSCGAGGPECAPQRGHRGRGSVCAEHVKRNKVPDNAPELCTLSMADEKCKQEDARDTVHYYWGIPFCPKGVDPNQYTQVILCQLEVYQKSLKQAQRQLLQKKEFGDPVVPCSSPLSQNEHGKGERINRANGVPDDTDDGRKEPESAAWLLATKNREPEQNPGQNLEEEKNSASEDEPTTSYCQGPTCARDQTPAKASQALFAEDMPEDGEPMQITQSISALTPFGSKRSPDIATESPAEEEITACPETQPNPSEAIEPEREELRSASKDAPLQAGGDEGAGNAVSECSPSADDSVSCPLCDRGFPAAEIELHAMCCNGSVGQDANEDVPALAQRQRETRSRAGRAVPPPTAIAKCEKCYLCKALVPLAAYPRHVDGCLQTARDAQGNRRLRSAKDVGRSEGRLLSMLEMSECKSADAEVGPMLAAGGDPRHTPAGAEQEAGCSLAPESPLPHMAFSHLPTPALVSAPEAAGSPGGFQQQNKGSRRRRRKF